MNKAWYLAILFSGSILHFNGTAATAQDALPLDQKVKPALLEKVLREREVVSHAELAEGKNYQFFTLSLVRASLKISYDVITDYRIFKQVVPFVRRADFDSEKKILHLEGGIFGYVLKSAIKFVEKSPQWIEYEVVDGHFKTMKGNIMLQTRGETGTLVFLDGALTAKEWPPTFVMERGGEIVLSVSTRKMRDYLEDHKLEPQVAEKGMDSNVPKPRSRL